MPHDLFASDDPLARCSHWADRYATRLSTSPMLADSGNKNYPSVPADSDQDLTDIAGRICPLLGGRSELAKLWQRDPDTDN